MSTITVSIPHQLSQDEALARIKQALEQAKAQYSGQITDFRPNWNGYVGTFSGSARGFSASGTISVNPSAVLVDLTLPPIVMFFKGKIESGIHDQLGKLLG
jgi:hypothetical protein